ncbi:MAG: HPr family phosphocarrier protein [Lachnospiraceae bacterium]|nr:HPr family phosphocarrier protein [Lachnospiraceae bacterium]
MLEKFPIKFHDVADVRKFVHVVSKYDADFDLYCGSYCVDAKSILGIMTMDLKSKLLLSGNCEPREKDQLMNELNWISVA